MADLLADEEDDQWPPLSLSGKMPSNAGAGPSTPANQSDLLHGNLPDDIGEVIRDAMASHQVTQHIAIAMKTKG